MVDEMFFGRGMIDRDDDDDLMMDDVMMMDLDEVRVW